MKILIPTCRTDAEIEPMLFEIRKNTPGAELVYASCHEGASASVNRNTCLSVLKVGETAIMLDDDIRGFYPGWEMDLLRGMEAFPNTVAVSARLLNKDGSFGPTCARCYSANENEVKLEWSRPHCIMPTAAMAFVYRHKFDEGFVGSGWEDNDFFKQYVADDPDVAFVQSNRCRLVHLNEMKGQKGENWRHNQRHFESKWGRLSRVRA